MALQTVQVIDPVVRTLNSHTPKGVWVAKAIADGGATEPLTLSGYRFRYAPLY
jgi:hypothetical protein